MTSPQPDTYDPTDYPPFAVTVDVAVITVRQGEAMVLAHRRDAGPYANHLALPGTFVRPEETPEEAAHRALASKVAMTDRIHLEQLATYGAPDRDPRMRVVSVAHVALIADPGDPKAGEWVDPDRDGWAFDHALIVADALERAAGKIEYTTLAASLVGPEFTVPQLREVYEALWRRPVDPTSFHRKVTSPKLGFLVKTDKTEPASTGRPSRLYRAGPAATMHPPLLRDNA